MSAWIEPLADYDGNSPIHSTKQLLINQVSPIKGGREVRTPLHSAIVQVRNYPLQEPKKLHKTKSILLTVECYLINMLNRLRVEMITNGGNFLI